MIKPYHSALLADFLNSLKQIVTFIPPTMRRLLSQDVNQTSYKRWHCPEATTDELPSFPLPPQHRPHAPANPPYSAMRASVPELTPRQVGTPLPVSSQVPPETYTYDYIIVGGMYAALEINLLCPYTRSRGDCRLCVSL